MNSDRTESASEEHAVSVSAQSVRLWRFRTDSRSVTYRPYCPESVESEPGTWYPQPEDELREAVVAAAREYLEWDGNRNGVPNTEGILLDTRRLIETRKALVAAIDALTKGNA